MGGGIRTWGKRWPNLLDGASAFQSLLLPLPFFVYADFLGTTDECCVSENLSANVYWATAEGLDPKM